MTKLSIFTATLLFLPGLLLAQYNYVANSGTTSNTATYGTFNTFVGPFSGSSGQIRGNRNTAVGYGSAYSLSSGSFNSFFGVDAGEFTTTGSYNTFLGRGAGLSNTTGSYNAFTGYQAGYSNTSGNYNVFSGYQAGYSNSTGNNNVFTGYASGVSNTIGKSNVFTGNFAGGATRQAAVIPSWAFSQDRLTPQLVTTHL